LSVLSNALRRSLVGTYLAGSSALAGRALRGHSGRRDFSRVIIVAALQRSNGIAIGARLQCAALRKLGVDADLLDATPALRNPLFRISHRPGTAYVFHAGGPQTANLITSVLPHAADAFRVGYWAWELPDPPLDWSGCDRNVSEIWTPSTFSKASLLRLVDRPIEVVPHYVPLQRPRQRNSKAPFTILAMADSRSSWSRKNPEGAVRAFQTAFGPSPSARLVVKLSGRAKDSDALEESLGNLLRGGNIEIIRNHLDDDALAALYRSADVFLSLHRAEGYGLPLNEAMAHGLPVIATGWSGNLDFMAANDSFLVPYTLIPVNDASAVYSGSTWAEPDLTAAARALRRFADDPEYYAVIAAAAHQRAGAATPRFPFLPQRDAVAAAKARPGK
jgi:glycosyltransferase involved in cell wall biosynthesis